VRVLIGETEIGGRSATLYVLPDDRSSSVRIGDPDLDYIVPGPELESYVEALQRLCRAGGFIS